VKQNTNDWYIIKQENGTCQIQPADLVSSTQPLSSWGPFSDRETAITKKIGLIRAGFCQPE
jgi:hypothetical protein